MKNLSTKRIERMSIPLIVLSLFLCSFSARSQWQQVWSDEFDGPTLNTSNWNIEVNDFGGYNNEVQYYTDRSQNIRIENEALVIEARKENYLTRNYTSARINSEGKRSWKYGKIEAKMKLPYGNGMWPAFWMMGNTGEWPACGEIDIMEMVGGTQCGNDCGDNKTHGYMWYSDNGDKVAGSQAPVLQSGIYADDYHLFSVEWDESSIKWLVDNVQFHSESITASSRTEFHQPFYIILNLAVGGDWPLNPPASTVFPQKLYIDYVRVYEKVSCTAPAQAAAISGNTSVTSGSSQTYSVAAVSGATSYSWILPSGWSGSSSTNSITTTAGSSGGTISVKANNSCGSGPERTLNISISNSNPSNLALNKPVTVSSIEGAGLEGNKANDNSLSSRWASATSDPQWIYVDLGSNYSVNRVKINWEAAYGKNYQVQVSTDASTWLTIKTVTNNTSLTNDYSGLSGTGRYVRILGTARGTVWGYSIYELEVYGTAASGGTFTTRIEAENYTYMSGVIKESCSEGGQNIGAFDVNDWMSYTVNIPVTGTYKVSYRVSSIYANKSIRLEKDNGATHIGTATLISSTGSGQNWTTITDEVTLTAGQYSIGLTTVTGGINLNWFEISNDLSGARLILDEASTEGSLFYPNPAKDILIIRNSFNKSANVQVLDFSGNIVKKVILSKGEKEINMADLASGGYLIKVASEGTTKVEKVYKE